MYLDTRESYPASLGLQYQTNIKKSNCVRRNKYKLNHQGPPDSPLSITCAASLPSTAQLSLALPLVITLQRDASQKTRYTLLDLDPIPHQPRQLLRSSLILRNKLHPHRSRASASAAVLDRLEDERGAEVVLRRHAHLSVIVEGDFDAEYRRERLAKLGRFRGEDLSQAQQPLFLVS